MTIFFFKSALSIHLAGATLDRRQDAAEDFNRGCAPADALRWQDRTPAFSTLHQPPDSNCLCGYATNPGEQKVLVKSDSVTLARSFYHTHSLHLRRHESRHITHRPFPFPLHLFVRCRRRCSEASWSARGCTFSTRYRRGNTYSSSRSSRDHMFKSFQTETRRGSVAGPNAAHRANKFPNGLWSNIFIACTGTC